MYMETHGDLVDDLLNEYLQDPGEFCCVRSPHAVRRLAASAAPHASLPGSRVERPRGLASALTYVEIYY
jgi:hypothetical protein